MATSCAVAGAHQRNKTGFDPVGLFVGSEGLLGVVNGGHLAIAAFATCARAALSTGFRSMRMAARAIQAVFQAGFPARRRWK